jgi:uncharacterized protein
MNIAMKNSGKLMLTLTVLALAAILVVQTTGALAPLPVAAASPAAVDSASLPRTITVVGVGEMMAQPDMGTATIGVEVKASTVKEATSQAAEKMDSVMAALAAQGVADKDIQTTNYSIYYEERYPTEMPVRSEGEGASEPNGVYRVSNMVNVKIRDMDKVAQVIDAVVEAGANNLWGVDFILEDTSSIEEEARAKAIENAYARAADLARLTDVSLGEVVEVTEVVGANAYGGYGLETAKLSGLGGGSVSPGELEVSMRVQVTFAIE